MKKKDCILLDKLLTTKYEMNGDKKNNNVP